MKAFNLKPFREIGQIKETVLEGEIPNKKEACYNFMLKNGK
jgi:hypothetical protein|tara:strand:+ start:1284 stop:1406 length:123 start_codon:yes stop_codon:yes gene_type:complete